MPLIKLKLTKPLPSNEIKDEIAKEIIEIMVKKLNKEPNRVIIVFEECEADDFYFGLESVSNYRKRIKNGK